MIKTILWRTKKLAECPACLEETLFWHLIFQMSQVPLASSDLPVRWQTPDFNLDSGL